MIIDETPLGGRVSIETGAWGGSSYTWTDQSSTFLNGTYNEGGQLGTPGASLVDVGNLSATFRSMASVPAVGSLIRIRRTGTTEYAFTGYIQDVQQTLTLDPKVSLTVPVVFTTLYCLDWVGYVSQFQVEGIGGADYSTGVVDTTSRYQARSRIGALNRYIDATGATQLITYTGTSRGLNLGDTTMVGSISDHLDLATVDHKNYWHGTHALPTNLTTGRTGLIDVRPDNNLASSSVTFTDGVGSTGDMHYTEIEYGATSQNIANVVTAYNSARFPIIDDEVTKIGGSNQTDFVTLNGVKTPGINYSYTWTHTDSTSVATYGNRLATINTCGSIYPKVFGDGGYANFVSNPSVEYSDNGYSGSSSAVTRRRKPTAEATPFSAFDGDWAMRARIKTAVLSPPIVYNGSENDGIPVVAGRYYRAAIRVARTSGLSRADTRCRARIVWLDSDENIISTLYGSQMTLTNAGQWYEVNIPAGLAPANAVRATVAAEFNRSGGTQFPVGDHYWADAFLFGRSSSANSGSQTYFDGDTAPTSTGMYIWTGQVGDSASYYCDNGGYAFAAQLANDYGTTSNRATRIRWNAQEDLTKVASLTVNKTISLKYNGTTATYRIVGISANISYSRYMIDFYLELV